MTRYEAEQRAQEEDMNREEEERVQYEAEGKPLEEEEEVPHLEDKDEEGNISGDGEKEEKISNFAVKEEEKERLASEGENYDDPPWEEMEDEDKEAARQQPQRKQPAGISNLVNSALLGVHNRNAGRKPQD